MEENQNLWTVKGIFSYPDGSDIEVSNTFDHTNSVEELVGLLKEQLKKRVLDATRRDFEIDLNIRWKEENLVLQLEQSDISTFFKAQKDMIEYINSISDDSIKLSVKKRKVEKEKYDRFC